MPTLYSWCAVSPHSSGYRFSHFQKPLNARTVHARPRSFSDVQLSFSKLSHLELVTDQFTAWGVRIQEAIAIKPSNFAFSSCIESLVLIPLTRHNRIALQFDLPKKNVSVSVTAPRSVQLLAYSGDRHVSTQSVAGHTPPVERAEEIRPFPSHTVQIKNDAITQVTLHSTAPFTLQSVSFH